MCSACRSSRPGQREPTASPIHSSLPCRCTSRSKGKNKEKVNNAILFDKTSYEKMLTEAPKYKMITISILSDRLRINCSLARRAITELKVWQLVSPYFMCAACCD